MPLPDTPYILSTDAWAFITSSNYADMRSKLLNSGTLTSDAPVTISQTWNAVGQTFKALVVNAAGSSDANSASGSLLLDLQLGGVSKFKVGKDGYPVAADGSYNVPAYRFSGGGSTNGISLYANSIYVNAGGSPQLSVHSSFVRIGPTLYFSVGDASNSHDIALTRDGAGQLALRNGAAAQTFNVYGTYTSAASYARLAISCDTSGNATLTTQSTGVAGTVSINGVPVGLGAGNIVSNVVIGTSASLAANNNIVAIGYFSSSNVSGIGDSVSIGAYSAQGANSGNNVSIGAYSHQQGGAFQSVAVGAFASQKLGGSSNSIVGAYAMQGTLVGSNNNAFGRFAGRYITDGTTLNTSCDNSIFIGANTRPLANSQTNQIVIGDSAIGIGSNSVVLGNDSITKTALKGNVGIGTTSPTSKLDVYLNPAANYTTEKVQFGNVFFGNAVSNYSALWMGGISPALTLTNSNFVLASDGSGTILNSPAGSGITFQVNGTNRWAINTSGHFLAAADNSYDIGANGANRPRDIYAGGNGIFGGLISAQNGFRAPSSSQLIASANGIWRLTNSDANDFNRLQFGGTTNLFPAIKRNAAGLQIRLADDSANATLEAGNLYAAGNVGIGTTAPGSTLTVAGTFHFGSNNGALIGGTSYGGHLGSTQYFGLRSTSAVSTTIYLQNNSSGDKNAVIRILGSGSGADHGALDINTIESSPILFTTGLSNERMRITAAGNVGIGTTSPTSKLHVAETWNAAGTTFAAAKIVVTDTASAAASTLLELWSDSVTPTLKYSFGKSGVFKILGGNNSEINCNQLVTNNGTAGNTDWGVYLTNSSGIILKNTLSLGWSNGVATLGADTILLRDGEQDHLAMRRSTNGQKFSVYGTWSALNDYRRLSISCDNTTGNATIATVKGSATSGTAGEISITSGGALNLRGNTYFSNTGGTGSWRIDSNLFPQANNTFDFGSASSRVKSGYFGTSIVNAGYAEHAEMTAPAAPAANSVRIYAEDDGTGKTRLMALFATGVAQQIAIEP